uniref:Zerknuellt 4 n=2 Tax=Episyrphus balteatus TaxID=286459 RepID=B5M6Y4_EPIBA|nr:zerknuellt 4 [Episyrphus balteatus]
MYNANNSNLTNNTVTKEPAKKSEGNKGRRIRTAFSDFQIMELEKEFEKCIYLHRPRKIDISKRLSLSENHVKVWFQNRRMKVKKSPIITNGNKIVKSSRPDYKMMIKLMNPKQKAEKSTTPTEPLQKPEFKPEDNLQISKGSCGIHQKEFEHTTTNFNQTEPWIQKYEIINYPTADSFQQHQTPSNSHQHNHLQHSNQTTQVYQQHQYHPYQPKPYEPEQHNQQDVHHLVEYQPDSSCYMQPLNLNQCESFQQTGIDTLINDQEIAIDLNEFLNFQTPEGKLKDKEEIECTTASELLDLLNKIQSNEVENHLSSTFIDFTDSLEKSTGSFSLSESAIEKNLQMDLEDISIDKLMNYSNTPSITNASFDEDLHEFLNL